MATEMRAKLVVDAQATGDEQIERLADELDAMATAGGKAAPRLQLLAAEMRSLSQQQGLIDQFAALKKQTADYALAADKAQEATKQSALELKALRQAQEQAGGSARGIAGEIRAAEAAFRRNRAAAAAANQAYRDGQVGLQQLRDAMSAAGLSSGNLAQAQARVRREAGEVRRWVDQIGPAWQRAGQQATVAAASQQASGRKMAEGVRSISKELATVRQLYLGVQAVLGAAGAARGLAATADEANNLQARLKLATGEGRLFDEMWDKVSATALRTNSALAATSDLFSRITVVGKDAGLGAQQAADQALAITETINQAVQLSGASASASDAAVTQLIQGLQSGVLRGDEFNSVMEQAPRLARALVDGLKVTTGELRAMAQEGKLSSEVVIGALQSQAATLEAEFGSLPQTIGRSMQNLTTSWQLFVGQVDQGAGASTKVAAAIDLLADNLDTVATVALRAGLVVAAMVAVKAIKSVYDLGAAALGSARAIDAVAASSAKAGAEIDAAAAAKQRFATIARGIGYALIAEQVLKIGVAYAELRKQQQLQARLSEEVAEKDARIAGQLREISAATGVTVRSMEELNAAQAAGTLVFSEAEGRWRSAAQALQQLAEAAGQSADELASINATKLVEEFAAAAAEAGKTEEAIKKLAESLRFEDVSGAAGFVRALDAMRNTGVMAAEQVGQAWQLALQRLDAGQLGALRANLESAAQQGVLSAQQLAQANEQILGESFKRLGVNAAQAMGRVSEGAQQAIDSVALVADGVKTAGLSAEDAARAIELAFESAVPKADSLQAVELLAQRLEAVAASGQLGADGLERMRAALERQRQVVEDQLPGIQSLEEAYRKLGVTSRSELQRMADEARQAWERIKGDVNASVEIKRQAWQKMAEAVIAANNGVADAALKAEAAQLGLKIEVDASGKAVVKSAQDAAAAAREQAKAQQEVMRAIQAKAALQQAELALQAAGVRLSMEQQRAMLEAARARGDEKAVMAAQNEMRRLEIELTRINAEAKRAEAEAAMAAAQARKNEALAAGEYYGAKQQEIDAAIKAAEAKAKEAEIAEHAAAAQQRAAAAAEGAGEKAAEGAEKAREAHEQAAQAIEFTWLSAATQVSRHADEAARHAEDMAGSMAKYFGAGMSWGMYIGAWNSYYGELRRLAEDYAQTLERLDAQQQALEQRNSGAARGVDELRMRLLELNGSEEEVAQARAQRERAEVERQIQLAQLEAERASVRGDHAAAQRFAEETALLREQLALLGQIEQAEKRQRKERAQNQGGNGGGGSGGSGGTSGGGRASGGTFNVTLNANGVNDPARLARLIEPELKKLARLAR